MSEREIFTAAREMTDPAARLAYLDGACGPDAGLRARVMALLRAHDQPDSLLDHPAVAPPDPAHAATEALNGTPASVAAATRTVGGENSASDDEALAFLAPSARADSLGRLGHYEVLQILGKGGFGIVFRALDETLQRVVALKVMAPQLAATSPARKRFLREARSSAQVRHENVVQVYEVAEQPLPYLAMEFIPGETLQQRLDRVGPVEPVEVVRIGRQIAEGLAAAHATDLIHRDIKPGNVLLEGGHQKVKITDFGLARAADDASISQSGIIAGTPMYMAPEQAKGETLDQRADLFSLGSVLYQMAAGRPPFRAPSALAVLKRVAEEPPRPIPEIIPETPAWLCEIIAKLHAKNPDDRYQSAREVADVLADCEAQLKAHAKVKDFSRIPRGKPQRSGRWKWASVAAVLLLPVIGLGVTEFAGVTHLFRQQATTDPDRKAAEYVLSIGGQVQVDGRDRNLNSTSELPRDPFRLTWVGLMHNNQVSQTGLANFNDCHNLTFLGLFDTSVSDEGLANFQNSKNLTFLNLSRTKISDAGLANFKNCTELTAVVLSETKVSDAGLDYLKNSKQLRNLFLQKTNVTAAGIDELKKALPLCKIEWDGGVSAPPRSTAVAWGQVTDPLGDCQFTEADGRLTIAVPGDRLHDLSPLPGCNLNSPRVLREVAGDFEAHVTVLPFPRPTSVYSTGPHPAYVGAGLVVWSDEAGILRLFRAYSGGSLVTSEWYNGLALGGQKWIPVPDGPMHLRIRRTGETLHLESSTDGQRWTESATATNLRPASRVRVGVAVVNAIKQEFTVQFEGFEIKERPPSSLPPSVGTESGAKDKPSPPTIAPFTDADVQRIAALPAEQQVEEVRKELRQRNPGFDGKMETKIEGGVVTEFRIVTDHVTDIAPIRVFNALRVLDCSGTRTPDWRGNGLLADLNPLKGVNFSHLIDLNFSWTKLDDAGLAHFKDCKDLTGLKLRDTGVTDAGLAHFKDCKNLTYLDLHRTHVGNAGLAHFKGCKDLMYLSLPATGVSDAGLALFKECKSLTTLDLSDTPVSDAGLATFKDCKNLRMVLLGWATEVTDAGLASLKDCKNLMTLDLRSTKVTDLSLLRGMPLKELWCDFQPERDAAILRSIKTLEKINGKPAAEFWKSVERK